MPYLIYLRKSRADKDAELRGEGETLARHEKELLHLAQKMNLNITAIYKEILSGDTIDSRPEMQRLLSEVEQGFWEGVLVAEVERLARGNTKDQGIVADAFKISNTKIITLTKTYDPSNEFDEEYFEFGLFMSRREYKTINRRIQRGRIASVQEGKYIAGTAPYGYKKVRLKNDKGFTLEIIPEEANVVKTIYDLYTKGILLEDETYRKLGMHLICKKLDELQIKSPSGYAWSRSTVKDILTNPTYTGKIRWQWRKVSKKIVDGSIIQSRKKDKNCMLIDGLHPAIITLDMFEQAEKILDNKLCNNVIQGKILKNPLSGLVYCGLCGHLMTRAASNTKTKYPVMLCPNRDCNNISSPLLLVETRILTSLNEWVQEYKLAWKAEEPDKPSIIIPSKKFAIEKLVQEIDTIKFQLDQTHDLLEQGVYTTEMFLTRNKILSDKINILESNLLTLSESYHRDLRQQKAKTEFIPHIEELLKLYNNLDNATSKNELLKEIIDHVIYTKITRNTKFNGDTANFEITLYPKMPKV